MDIRINERKSKRNDSKNGTQLEKQLEQKGAVIHAPLF